MKKTKTDFRIFLEQVTNEEKLKIKLSSWQNLKSTQKNLQLPQV